MSGTVLVSHRRWEASQTGEPSRSNEHRWRATCERPAGTAELTGRYSRHPLGS